MGLSLARRVAQLPPRERELWLNAQSDQILEEINRGEWWWTSRPEQVPPPGDWLVALALAGRGWGKSRAGAEWLIDKTVQHPFDKNGSPTEWLLIGETLADARTICMEGPAGLLQVLYRRQIQFRYKQSPRPMVLFPNGSRIYAEGADDEDVGRGYNASGAWVDEICKWPKPYESWYEGILPSLRVDLVDDHPRCFATTTPKPIKLLQEWVKRDDGTIHIMGGSTFDNADNLSTHVLRELKRRYAGTALGQQELYGKLLELGDGGLFRRLDIINNRVKKPPLDLIYTVVGVDPNLTGEDDLFGIVVVGRDVVDEIYVLEDASVEQSGRTAALAAWRAVAKHKADLLVYEENLGKRYLAEVLIDAYKESITLGLFPAHTTPPMKAVHAKHGKRTRAEPVAMRNEQGRLHMVGEWEELENEMVMFDPEASRESPDRMDALVHGALHLMKGEKNQVKVSDPGAYQLNLPNDFYDLSRLQPDW